MLIMARDRSYDDLLKDVKAKNVYVWTCNTCARLCYGVGGKDSAERLARKLAEDGINVTGVGSTSASCIGSSVRRTTVPGDTDMIISLTCDIGAACARSVFQKEALNPIVTFGPGMISEDRGPVLVSVGPDGTVTEKRLTDICGHTSQDTMPFV